MIQRALVITCLLLAALAIDRDKDGFHSDADLDQFRDCCDTVEDGCFDPYIVNPGAYEIPHNGQDDSCNEAFDFDYTYCDNIFVPNEMGDSPNELSGPNAPAANTEKAIYAMDICEFVDDDDDPTWGFKRQLNMVFSLCDGTRNGFDQGINGPDVRQTGVYNGWGKFPPASGDYVTCISSGNSRYFTQSAVLTSTPTTDFTSDDLNPSTVTAYPSQWQVNVAGFPEGECSVPTNKPTDAIQGIKATFTMVQPSNMNAFSFKGAYFDTEPNPTYPPQVDTVSCSATRSYFVALKSNGITDAGNGTISTEGESPDGNFALDEGNRAWQSGNSAPDFYTYCSQYSNYPGTCYNSDLYFEGTPFASRLGPGQPGAFGASGWKAFGTSAVPYEQFQIEFLTADSENPNNNNLILLDDYHPISEKRTSSSITDEPYGYQFTADLKMDSLGSTTGIFSRETTSITINFQIQNEGPEEANDITVSFTPPLGTRASAVVIDNTNVFSSCTVFTAASPFEDNSFHKCKRRSTTPLANQAVVTGSVTYDITDLSDRVELRFRITATSSSIDKVWGNNFVTETVSFEVPSNPTISIP